MAKKNEHVGERAPCSRCGAPCVVRGGSNDDARMLALAKKPKGVCPSCGFHLFLRDAGLLDGVFSHMSPGALRLPHIQEMVGRVMEVGKADVLLLEVDFERVIQNWELPLK